MNFGPCMHPHPQPRFSTLLALPESPCTSLWGISPQDTTDVISVPEVLLFFAIPWTVAYQVPPSVEFSRPQSWSELPFPSPGQTLYLRSPFHSNLYQ